MARRITDFETVFSVHPFVLDVLQKKRPLEEQQNTRTALHIACINSHIPIIVNLLKQGANLYLKDKVNKTAYDRLAMRQNILFAVREALNNGPHPSFALLSYLFNNALNDTLIPDLSNEIKTILSCLLSAQIERDAEANIWNPIATYAYQLAKAKLTNFKSINPKKHRNHKQCLTSIMALSQNDKTKLNIMIHLANLYC